MPLKKAQSFQKKTVKGKKEVNENLGKQRLQNKMVSMNTNTVDP